jgi:hypothetical protein
MAYSALEQCDINEFWRDLIDSGVCCPNYVIFWDMVTSIETPKRFVVTYEKTQIEDMFKKDATIYYCGEPYHVPYDLELADYYLGLYGDDEEFDLKWRDYYETIVVKLREIVKIDPQPALRCLKEANFLFTKEAYWYYIVVDDTLINDLWNHIEATCQNRVVTWRMICDGIKTTPESVTKPKMIPTQPTVVYYMGQPYETELDLEIIEPTKEPSKCAEMCQAIIDKKNEYKIVRVSVT